MSLCNDCISGVKHEGTPEGKIEEIAGVKCYIATPSGEYDKNKVILYLPDVFGMPLVNAQLMADSFASNGFRTIIIDYFNGDEIPADAMFTPGEAKSFNIMEWFGRHGQEQTMPPLLKVIDGLKAQGVTVFGATGYCFGARYAVDLALENTTKVIVMSHPSLLEVPSDFEKLIAQSNNPVLINSCEFDERFPKESQKIADEMLGDGKYKPGYLRTYWEGCNHGFAVRGDLSQPQVKKGKEGAFQAAVDFFKKHL